MKKLYVSCLLATLSPLSIAAAITAVHQGAGPDGYQLVFKNAGVQPAAFTTESPASIVLDFPNTTSNLASREVAVSSHGIYNVDVVPGQGSTRAVVRLSGPMFYKVSLQGKDVVLNVSSSQQGNRAVPLQQGSLAGLANASVSSTPASNNVHFTQAVAVDKVIKSSVNFAPLFKKNEDGNGTLTFNLPNANTQVNVRSEGTKIVADISGYKIDKDQQKRMELTAYSTPVNFADVQRTGSGTKVTLNMGKNPYEFVTYQSGNAYTIEVMKPKADPMKAKVEQAIGFSESKKYRGERLSLNFQDIEVRAVLQIIAEFTNQNIVVSDSVVGNITLRLDNVPWDQALDIILKTKGLDKRTNGSIIYVAPQTELSDFELTALKRIREEEELLPTRTEYIQVKFAKASDIMAIIEKSRQNVGSGSSNVLQNTDSILSSKGSVTVDERTNTLLVNDIPAKLQAVRDLVAKLDEPVRQVLVDARLVLTTDNFSKDLGARLGLSFVNRNSNNLLSGSGTLAGASSLNSSIVAGNNPVALPNINDRLGVNLPVSGTTSSPASYGLAILGKDFLVDLELSALETEGQVELVSSPRVVTQDGNKARVASGTKIPIVIVDADGSTSLSYESAELSMDITPRIAPNNTVDLELDIRKNEPGTRVEAPGISASEIKTNELNTHVLVDNGETIVLGGIYEQRQQVQNNKVPLLGDLPVVGNAFKSKKQIFNKSELLIFITPRIVDKRLAEQDKFSSLRE